MIRWLAIGFTLFIISVVALANTQANIFAFVNTIPLGDKWGHFILMGTLTLLINLAMWQSGRSKTPRDIITTTLWITLIVTLEECSQYWLPTRTFSLLDLTFDYLGIFVFSLLAIRFITHKQKGA